MPFNEPQEVLSILARAYYDERNMEKILSCVTDEVEWVGTENNDNIKGKTALKKRLEADFAAHPEGFYFELNEPMVQPLGTDVVMFTITGKRLSEKGATDGVLVRGTICFLKTEQGWLVCNGHTSVPNAELEKMLLQSALQEERAKEKALLDNVPGGVAIYRIKKDGRFQTDYVSDGLAKICGYNDVAEALKVAGYDSRELVLPEDYPLVEAACKESIKQGAPTSIQYRVRGKDGTPVRITLDSVLMKNATLGEDDIAVFYAVHTLVSHAASQKAQEQTVLLSLLNTVPAGIGIYEVKNGVLKQQYMNDAFFTILHSTREDRYRYSGENVLTAIHPQDLPNVQKGLAGLVQGADSMRVDYRLINGLGGYTWFHVTASVAERQKGYIKFFIAFSDCTESKEQELQLLQNQRAVELAQTQCDIAIWTYNIDRGTILQQIHSAEKSSMGYRMKIENVPQCFVDAGDVYPDDMDVFLKAYQDLADGKERVDVTYRLCDQRTGKFSWLRMFYQRMEDTDKNERMAVGFSMNVDQEQEAIERYHTEQKVREQMYADAKIYMEYDLTERVYVGKSNLAERYLQGSWETQTIEEYRANMSENVDPPYLDEVVEKMYAGNLLKAFEQGETKISCDYRSKERPHQPSLWCRITAIMVKRPDTGNVTAFVYVEDIEREKARQFAMESSLSNGIENVAVIHIADKHAWLIQSHHNYVPKEMEKEFIYDDHFVNRAHRAVSDDSAELGNKAALLSTVLAELEKQEIYQYTVATKRGGDVEKRQLMRFRYLDDRKADIILSVSDITAVYLEEQKKKQLLEDALCEAQKASSAKAEFYSRMSHDMRTPMNGILGMAELSKDETDSARLKENIEKINESGEYLLSLINDTLDIQRIESGKMKLEPSIVRTTDVVANIIDMISVTAKAKGVHLKYSQGNTDLNWYVRADALRLKQVFINLLSNAVKFTPRGGTVELNFKLLARDGMISHDVIYVRDTGIGMSKTFLETEIFKPFSQESNAVSATYAGSGLGLSIAKSLVELMGGRIEVESEVGVGTTFAVYLDFERVNEDEAKAALQGEKKQAKNVSEQLKGKNILLAEDHPLNAEIAKRLLQKVGCTVTCTQNGQEVVNCFADAPAHTFDAVLMDIRMPVMNGLEACRAIRALSKEDAAAIPIIAMTANAYEEDKQAALDAGMNAHLGKPIESKLLYDTLAMYLCKEK